MIVRRVLIHQHFTSRPAGDRSVFFSTEKGEFPQITAVTVLSQAAAVTAYLQEEAFGSPKMGGCHTAYLKILGKPPESIG